MLSFKLRRAHLTQRRVSPSAECKRFVVLPALPVHLLYPNRRHLPRRVRAWMDWLAEVMADYLA